MLEQVNKHAVLPVAFDVVVPDDAVPDDTAGIRQAVRQLATCELQVIMQLVVVEVSGVARPWKSAQVYRTRRRKSLLRQQGS